MPPLGVELKMPPLGVEPKTSGLQDQCSATELKGRVR